MERWDDDNFEPPAVIPSLVKSNKWVGEDEDDDVKESWEDEDEENKEDEEAKTVEVRKKKKTLQDKIAEKEAKKREELERRLKEQQEEEIPPEEKLRMQKESDLKIALETTFGVKEAETVEIGGLILPNTTEEFEEFTESLSKQLMPLSRHGNNFVNFAEGLARNLCAGMNSSDIKKIKNTLDNLHLEKQKIEKGDKSKKNKGKGKAKLKVEGENEQLSAYVNDYDDFDDFM